MKIANFFIRQIFLIRFFMGWTRKRKFYPINTFHSIKFDDDQWTQTDDGWWHTSFKQLYGTFRFIAMLTGPFSNIIRPALWLSDDTGNQINHYYEADIELWLKNNKPHLVCTSYVNNDNKYAHSEYCKIRRFNIYNKKLIERLQMEYHNYCVRWKPRSIEYYIDGLLIGILINSPSGAMNIIAGSVVIKDVTAIRL